jgi:hypothetical protein
MRQLSAFPLCFYLLISGFLNSTAAIDPPIFSRLAASPLFSGPGLYNSFNFCASPLGLLEEDSVRVRLRFNFNQEQWHAYAHADSLLQRYQAWDLPDILIGKPRTAYLALHYAPGTISDDLPAYGKRSLPLQRFGLAIAAQAPSGIFQIGFLGNGYYGTEKIASGDNNRLIMGLEDLELLIGSRIHELMAIGLRGGATAKLDTLRYFNDLTVHDRYFTGQIPRIGGYAIFGKSGFPVSSDFSLQIATHRFVYVTWNDADQDPIKGDSLGWKWQTMGEFMQSGFTYHPAFQFSYWKNAYQDYAPTDNNDDLNVGRPQDGMDWKMSDFQFGIGASTALRIYGEAWFEYTHSAMKLAYGSFWPALADKKRGYDRISFGAQANIHAIPLLRFPSSIETKLRFGYFNQRENSGINAMFSDDFGMLNPMTPNSQRYRYQPDFGWGPDQRIYGFDMGLEATFLNRMIGIAGYLELLARNADTRYSGSTAGAEVTYYLR